MSNNDTSNNGTGQLGNLAMGDNINKSPVVGPYRYADEQHGWHQQSSDQSYRNMQERHEFEATSRGQDLSPAWSSHHGARQEQNGYNLNVSQNTRIGNGHETQQHAEQYRPMQGNRPMHRQGQYPGCVDQRQVGREGQHNFFADPSNSHNMMGTNHSASDIHQMHSNSFQQSSTLHQEMVQDSTISAHSLPNASSIGDEHNLVASIQPPRHHKTPPYEITQQMPVFEQVGMNGHALEQQHLTFSHEQSYRFQRNHQIPTHNPDIPCYGNGNPSLMNLQDYSKSANRILTHGSTTYNHHHPGAKNMEQNGNTTSRRHMAETTSNNHHYPGISNGVQDTNAANRIFMLQEALEVLKQNGKRNFHEFISSSAPNDLQMNIPIASGRKRSKPRRTNCSRVRERNNRGIQNKSTTHSQSDREENMQVDELINHSETPQSVKMKANSKLKTQDIVLKNPEVDQRAEVLVKDSSSIDVKMRHWFEESGRYHSEELEQQIISDKFKITKKQVKIWFANHNSQELGNDKSQNIHGSQEIVGRDKQNSCVVSFNIRSLNQKKINYLEESFSVLREAISWSLNSKQGDNNQSCYPNAPLAELWLRNFDNEETELPRIAKWKTSAKHSLTADHTLLGRRWLWDEGHFTDGVCHTNTYGKAKKNPISNTSGYVPISERAYCACGLPHFKNELENDASPYRQERGARRNARSGTSVNISSVLSELANGSLNAHTLISCDEYNAGPEFRYLIDPDEDDPKEIKRRYEESQDLLEEHAPNVNLDGTEIQPFEVKVCEDVAFIADLHSHISNSEVIGLLGGRYDDVERCLYIQAAFPCKSTVRKDEGFTDVEMDPASQVIAGEAISQHGMKVVGWYHSHPTFQPDPSVTDIHNQKAYQTSILDHPFVGLIVGTFDSANPSSQSVMRWFHVAEKKQNTSSSSKRRNKSRWEGVHYPMKLKVTHRKARKYPSESIDTSEIVKKKKSLSKNGPKYRHERDMEILTASLKDMKNKTMFNDTTMQRFCTVINEGINDNPTTNGLITDVKRCEINAKPPTMAYYAVGEKEVLESGIQMPSNQILALEVLYGNDCESTSHINHTVNCSQVNDDTALAFTREDFEILKSEHISNDVRAAIIWHAVEREQAQVELKTLKTKPPSPLNILMRLYNTQVFGDIVGSSLHLKSSIADDDAIIIHSADAVLKHYMNDTNKIDPFDFSNFSMDIVSSLKFSFLPTYAQEYFRSTITESRNMYQMKIGHKITSSLLASVSHMHLNYRNRARPKCNVDTYLGNSNSVEIFSDIEFVSDIMRLLASRWREEALKNGETLQIKSQPQEKKKPGPKLGSRNKLRKSDCDSNIKNTPSKSKTPPKISNGQKRKSKGKSKRKQKKKVAD